MARLEGCVSGADLLVVQGGINDIAQGRSVDDAAANLLAMVRRGKELGLRVVIVDLLPWNNGWPDAEPKIRRLNALIAARTPIARDVCTPSGPQTATIRLSWATVGSAKSPLGWRTTARRRRRRLRARRRLAEKARRGDG